MLREEHLFIYLVVLILKQVSLHSKYLRAISTLREFIFTQCSRYSVPILAVIILYVLVLKVQR